MKGKVYQINQARAMVAVSTDENFSIFEILEDIDLDVNDVVSWQESHLQGSCYK